MGDKNRNIQFSKFINKQFPKIKTILVIADGNGELAYILAKQNLQVRVIEAKPRWKTKHTNITYQKAWFDENTEIIEDLIVGMHPDEATAEIMLAAKKQNKPFAVVPCCVVGKYANKKLNYEQWTQKLQAIFKCQSWQLNIYGKNVVLFQKIN